ncbi:hypothetical protein ACLOJK_017239 [Asimina triloba]
MKDSKGRRIRQGKGQLELIVELESTKMIRKVGTRKAGRREDGEELESTKMIRDVETQKDCTRFYVNFRQRMLIE